MTNTSDAALTVNEMVSRVPATLAVFRRHGIDTCCGGGHPIAEVARRHALDLPTLLAELQAVDGATETPLSGGSCSI